MTTVTIEPVITRPSPENIQQEVFDYLVANGPCYADEIADGIDEPATTEWVISNLEGLKYSGYVVNLGGNPQSTDYREWEPAEPNHIIRGLRVVG